MMKRLVAIATALVVSTSVVLSLGINTAFAAPLAKVQSKAYYYDPVAKTALAFGITAGLFTQAEALKISDALMGANPNDVKPVPAALRERWNLALYMAQAVTSMKALPNYFGLGYEIESGHETLRSWKDFDAGAKTIFGMVQGIFGGTANSMTKGIDTAKGDKPMAETRDGQGRKWDMKLEWIRENEGTATPSGWETNSPPFMNADEIELFAAFLTKLGNSPFGQSGDFTGIHQNFDVTPVGQKADPGVVARTIANFILLHEQFNPAIFAALEVERYGGYENLFARPYIFDHPEFLNLLSKTAPEKMTPELIQSWQKQFLRREADIQIENHFDEGPKKEAAKADWQNFSHNWKSRTVKVKWHEKLNRILVESRIMDHKPKSPWIAIKGTLLMQAMLNRSYELAKEGKLFQIEVPVRGKKESIQDYWARIEKNPKMGMDALIEALALKDKGAIGVIANRDFKTEKNFAASNQETYGFEVEFLSPNFVMALTPSDAKQMPKWETANLATRTSIISASGVPFDNRYTDHKYSVLSAGYRLDINKYPYMEPRPHLEESGRLEIMSNGRGIVEISDLVKKANEIKAVVAPKTATGLHPMSFHFHGFMPNSMVRLNAGEVDQFTRLLERLSLYMNVADYAESTGERPPHRLDSWSLDRYSQKDLAAVRDHLLGRIKLSNSDQKYHNIGFRPVDNGIDLEMRASGSEVEYGAAVLQMAINAVKNKDFGPAGASSGERFFMEPQHYNSPAEYARFTLENALAKSGKLSAQQLRLAKKLQFEIYKPSMGYFVYFPEGNTPDSAPSDHLDTKYVRTNFETNIVLPLQPWESQSFISAADKKRISEARSVYLTKVTGLIQRLQKDPQAKFMFEKNDFLYLCDYLERSTHPSRPNFLKGPEADRQKQILENLVFEMRSFVVEFVNATRVDNALARSLSVHPVPEVLLTADTAVKQATVTPIQAAPKLIKERARGMSCSSAIGKTGS
ncbi:MAG TPA: hypothetical protein VM432_04230 [Bdellovibrionales bacterium]|nr:hypothetical protein [Bdellovibrionales bacterium]